MVLVVLTGIVICITLCYWWVKAVGALFEWLEPKKNSYVEAHKAKMKNDEVYQNYLNWLDKNGADIPLEKVKTKEELAFEKEMERVQAEYEIRNMFKGKGRRS